MAYKDVVFMVYLEYSVISTAVTCNCCLVTRYSVEYDELNFHCRTELHVERATGIHYNV